MSKGSSRFLLFTLAFLYIFSESTLAPFYPQFFQHEFGVSSAHLTGIYLVACRLAVVVMAPVWGILSQRFSLIKILPVTQLVACVGALVCYLTSSLWIFFAASLFMVGAKCSALLLYPELLKGKSERVQIICKVHLIANVAILVATGAGIFIMGLSSPRMAFLIAAGLELFQLFLCFLLRKSFREESKKVVRKASQNVLFKPWFYRTGLLLLMSYCAMQLIRPFFTKYVMSDVGLGLNSAGICFLVPFAVAAILLSVLMYSYRGGSHSMLIFSGLSMFLASLILQVSTGPVILLWLGRVLMGVVTVFLPLAFDEKVFDEAGETNSSKVYSWSFALQNLALIISPLCSAFLVDFGRLSWPFYAAILLTLFTLLSFSLNLQFQKNKVKEATL